VPPVPALVTLAALAGVCLTVQPGREMVVRYARFAGLFFAAAPFVAWVIVAFVVTVGAIGTLVVAVTSSAVALTYRWTARPLILNAKLEARTAIARREVRRKAADANATAGAVLAAASHQGALSGRPLPGQALDLPYSPTGAYLLEEQHGVPTLTPMQ
jgi:hypothetical protein